MGLPMAHVGLHLTQALPGHELLHRLHPIAIGGHLGLQISQQLLGIAHGPNARRQPLLPSRQIELALMQKQDVVEQQAFVRNGAAEGRHRTGGDPPHIAMVAATGHKKDQLAPLPAFCEDRCDGGDIGQMGAPLVGVVGEHHIPRGQGRALSATHGG